METQRVSPATADALAAERVVGGDDELTAAGWPRPRHGGWPIPWISPREELAQTDLNRLQACGTGAVCAVCGEGYQADEKAYAVTRPPDDVTLEPGDIITPAEQAADGEPGLITAIDNGVLHRRCARLALVWCPKLRELLEDGELVVLEVVAHDVEPRFLDLADPPRGKLVLTATFREGVVAKLPL